MTNPFQEERRATLIELAVAAARAQSVNPSLDAGPLMGEQPDPKLIDLLLAVARVSNRQGHVPQSEYCGRADGPIVELDTAEPFARQASTLLHWLGHAFDSTPATANHETLDRELVAEAVAVLVGQKLGLEVDQANLDYLASSGVTTRDMRRLSDHILATCLELEVVIASLADRWSA